MLSSAVELEIIKNPEITDQEIKELCTRIGYWSTLDMIASCRADFKHKLANRTLAEEKWHRRSWCGNTPGRFHTWDVQLYDKETYTHLWFCSKCNRVHTVKYANPYVNEHEAFNHPVRDVMESMKKSKLLRSKYLS